MGNMKYKAGNKVRIKSIDWYNENKDKYGDIDCGAYTFTYGMTKFCGKIVTILHCYNHGCYTIKEDDNDYTFTSKMIEGLVEEEMKSENELLDEYEELTDRAFKGGYEKCKSDIELSGFQLPEGYIFKDDNGNEILTSKIFLEKKKKEYPKTYKECCELLGCKADDFFTDFSYNNRDVEISDYEDKVDDLLRYFRILIYCRDAYWKLYGEEIGLGKSWEPDWCDYTTKYCIIYSPQYGGICKRQYDGIKHILAFPTAEMRDAFCENFKDLIEQCKEIL